MLLSKSMAQGGDFLFRWRSYILLIFLPPLILSFSEPEYVETVLGDRLEDVFEFLCLAIVAAGILVRIGTIGFVPSGTSGRNTRRQIAEELNTTGLYSITRNPLYLGNCLIIVGIMLFSQNLLLSLALSFFLVIYYERIILAEEAFLGEKFGDTYRDWAERVPVFFPALRDWRSPALPFSWRSAVRRDYTCWFLVIAALFAVEAGRDYFGEDGVIDTFWLVLVTTAAAAYCAIRLVKKKTKLLSVKGR